MRSQKGPLLIRRLSGCAIKACLAPPSLGGNTCSGSTNAKNHFFPRQKPLFPRYNNVVSIGTLFGMCGVTMQHLRGAGTVCEMTMQHLRGPFTVCKTTMQHLHGPFTVCEMTMQHLHSPFTVCGGTMQHLHSPFTVCGGTMQHLHSPFTVCETTMQGLRGLFTVCETIMQALRSLFGVCDFGLHSRGASGKPFSAALPADKPVVFLPLFDCRS